MKLVNIGTAKISVPMETLGRVAKATAVCHIEKEDMVVTNEIEDECTQWILS